MMETTRLVSGNGEIDPMSSSPRVQIAAFYLFGHVPSENIETLRVKLEDHGRELGLKGLVIFATEGLNGTVSGETQASVEESTLR